jgi:hypothetical protein
LGLLSDRSAQAVGGDGAGGDELLADRPAVARAEPGDVCVEGVLVEQPNRAEVAPEQELAASRWSAIKVGANAFTLAAAASGHTIIGTLAVATATSARFRSRRTAAETWVTYRLS